MILIFGFSGVGSLFQKQKTARWKKKYWEPYFPFKSKHENIKYSLTTNEKTIFLLTISGSTIHSAVS